jgi:preprotein translocase subunit SecD
MTMFRYFALATLMLVSACATTPPLEQRSPRGFSMGDAVFPANEIVSAVPSFQENGTPVINMVLTAQGARRLADITRRNVGKDLALRIDGKVLSSPRVMEPVLGGQLMISGIGTVEEAQAIAASISGKRLK